MNRAKFSNKNALFTVITVLLIVLFLEVLLNLFALTSPKANRLLASPREYSDRDIPHERLGLIGNPAFPEHDNKGFRNPEVPAKVDLVALGDSQTYGSSVKPEHSWPRQLENIIVETTYNMAYGGWGPPSSLILWDAAIAFEPKIVIATFYPGNDLYDAFNAVYKRNEFVELKSSDPQVQERVRNYEELEPLDERIRRIQNYLWMTPKTSMKPWNYVETDETRTVFSIKRLLSTKSKLYGLLRRTRYELKQIKLERPGKAWDKALAYAEAHAAYCEPFDNGQFKTVFTSKYRQIGLDLKDPRIAEGHKISMRAIQTMNKRADDEKIRFIVLLIPTKEMVFSELWSDPPLAYRNYTEMECHVSKITKDFLQQNGIEYIDALAALQECLDNKIQPYEFSWDGHPNKHGTRAIAKGIAAYLMKHSTEKRFKSEP